MRPRRLHVFLEEMKDIYRFAAFHEMVFVLSDESGIGIVVDEVRAVDMLSSVENSQLDVVPYSPFVREVERSEKIPEILLQIDVIALVNSVSYSYF